MTYDPERDLRAPDDVSPAQRPGEGRPSGGTGMVVFLLALIAVVGAGFAYFYSTQPAGNINAELRPPITQPSQGATERGSSY